MLKKSTGREVWAMLLDDSTEISTAGALTENHLYAVKAKANASGIPAGLAVGDCWFEVKVTSPATQTTLVSGDVVIDLGTLFDVQNLIGYARSKDITRTKSTIDMTVDGDLSDIGDIRVDPIVSVSGNINGYKVNNLPATSASRKIDAKFGKQIFVDNTNTITTLDKNDKPSVIALIYTKTVVDNKVDVDIVPCHFTSNGDSTDYGSVTSKSVAFTGCASSENGVLPCSLSVELPASA